MGGAFPEQRITQSPDISNITLTFFRFIDLFYIFF